MSNAGLHDDALASRVKLLACLAQCACESCLETLDDLGTIWDTTALVRTGSPSTAGSSNPEPATESTSGETYTVQDHIDDAHTCLVPPEPSRAPNWPTSDEGDTHTRLTRIVDENLGYRPTAPIPELLEALETELPKLVAEKRKLEEALGDIGALCDRCEDCDPAEAEVATYVTRHPLHGLPIFLCEEHAKETGAQYRKAESKGCGKQPEIEKHEQDTAVELALKALGEWLADCATTKENGHGTRTEAADRQGNPEEAPGHQGTSSGPQGAPSSGGGEASPQTRGGGITASEEEQGACSEARTSCGVAVAGLDSVRESVRSAMSHLVPFVDADHGDECPARFCDANDCECPIVEDDETAHRDDLCDCSRGAIEKAFLELRYAFAPNGEVMPRQRTNAARNK